jgi:glutathione synthase/RimK-type ligase-like ATP-grasp enzyme
MKLAIHLESRGFSPRWVQYCEENRIPYKIVSCYDSDIVEQLEDCDGLMWHWNQESYKGILFARQLTQSLELKGKKVFPNVNTGWHHDDKVGQKYLFECIGAPLVKAHVFYSKKEAEAWLETTTFPKVFKLRGGAGSTNVKLARTKKKAQAFINQAFGKGFLQINRWDRLKDRVWVLKRDRDFAAVKFVIKGIGRLFIPTELAKFSQREMGYVYFQDFLPNNSYDTRLVVIGNRCFGVRRYTRKNDFRASGSGIKAYEKELFDPKFIRIAFDTTRRMGSQSAAYDFIWDGDIPKIVEVSYCFITGAFYDDCPGYWDSNLVWHDKPVNPQYFMIEDFVKEIGQTTPAISIRRENPNPEFS